MLVATEPDFWAPLTTQEQFTHDKDRLSDRHGNWLIVLGRMGPGMNAVKAQAEMHVLAHQLELDHPDSNKNLDAMVYPATLVPGPYRGYVSAFTGLLLAVFVLVLLIACANAASLLLAARRPVEGDGDSLGLGRGARTADPADAGREPAAFVDCRHGGSAACVVDRAAASPTQASQPPHYARGSSGLARAVVYLAGLARYRPGLWNGSRSAQRPVDAAPVLKEETRSAGLRKSRLRSVLLIGEIATCVVLLACATLCVRSLLHANSIDPGFDTQHIAIATLDPGTLGYSPEKVSAFYKQLIEHVRRFPASPRQVMRIICRSGPRNRLRWEDTSAKIRSDPGRRISRRSGVLLHHGNHAAARSGLYPEGVRQRRAGAVVVNEVLARQLWPGQDPIGKRIAVGERRQPAK